MADKIRDVMTPDPATVDPAAKVSDAAKAMRDGDFGAVVVCENDQVRGILTDRDIVVRAIAEGKDPGQTEVEEVFTTDPTTLSPGDDIDDAVSALRDANVRR